MEKKKSKAINELSKQFHSIYNIKHYIITLFFDYHGFEQENTTKTPGKVVWIFERKSIKKLRIFFFPRKKTYLYSKNCGKINIGEKMTENGYSH